MAIIRLKAINKMVVMKANMRAFTPPRNKIPMAITAITMNAPISGSHSNNTPMAPTANAIGITARMKSSFTSILRTM